MMRTSISSSLYNLNMERFDASIKADFPEHNTPGDIETALDTLHKLKVAECDGIGMSPVSKVPAQILILVQVGLRRTIELTEGAIREINRRGFFERLSEFAHPNYHGMMATYTVEGAEGGFMTFCDRRKGSEKLLILRTEEACQAYRAACRWPKQYCRPSIRGQVLLTGRFT